MDTISIADVKIVVALREANVLQDVASHLLDQSQGVLLVPCPDGDHLYDIFSQQVLMQNGHRQDPRIHGFGWHSGALRLVAGSPANKYPHEDQIFLDEISDARKLKGINTVALYAHAPCGKARECGIDFLHLMRLLMQAKVRVKAMNNGIVAACFLHIAYPDKRRRTYFVSRPDWDQWIGTGH